MWRALLQAGAALSVAEHALPSLPVPYSANFPAFGTWSAVQLFPCDSANKNQTAVYSGAAAGATATGATGTAGSGSGAGTSGDVDSVAAGGVLSVGGQCLAVNFNAFGQDGQNIGGGGCPGGDPEQPYKPQQHWSYNATDATFRSAAYPRVCLHASAARPMAPLIQKTCHSVAPKRKGGTASGYDPRDQWDLLPSGVLRSRANASLCADHRSSLPPFTCSGQPFCDAAKPAPSRIQDLISRLDLGEKTLLLSGNSPGVARLGILPMAGGDELHGAGACGAASSAESSGCGTSFPHALCLAASFNRSLWRQVGDAISTENRALVNQGVLGMLNPWDPDLNLVRDPRCVSPFTVDTKSGAKAMAMAVGHYGYQVLSMKNAPLDK